MRTSYKKELKDSKSFGDVDVLKANALVFSNIHETLEKRWDDMKDIADYSVDGKVWVRVWGRDCDHCESTSIRLIDANYWALEAVRDVVYDDAEGPCSVHIIREDEAKLFKPSFRDGILEAFENGHPHCVYG